MTTTQPQPVAPAKEDNIAIPALVYPLCTRVWAKSPFTDPSAKMTAGDGILWAFGSDHPFVAGFKIVRMYVVLNAAVEVFSSDFSTDPKGATCLRHTLPWHTVLFIEEGMNAKTLVEEMLAAEEDEEDEEEEEEDEEEDEDDPPQPGELPPAPPQGQPLTPITNGGTV